MQGQSRTKDHRPGRSAVAVAAALALAVTPGIAIGAEDDGHTPGGGCGGGGGGGGGGGHTEGPGNNLAMPVIWGEPGGVRPELRGESEQCSLTEPVLGEFTTEPLAIPPEATYVMVGGEPVFLQQEETNEWQAESVELAASGLPLAKGRLPLDYIDWGDNIEAKDWTTNQMVRVETRLLHDVSGIVDDDPVDPGSPAGMTGFQMKKVGGRQTTEMWGVVGAQDPADPAQPDPATDPWRAVREQRLEAFAYTQGACLTVERIDRAGSVAWDADARAWTDEGAPICVGDVLEGPGGYGAEVTVSGGLTYGYVWHARGAPAGLYRLTFSLKPGSGVDFTKTTEIYAPESADDGHSTSTTEESADDGHSTHDDSSSGEHSGNTAVILPDLDLSYIDVGLSYDESTPTPPLDLVASRAAEEITLTWSPPVWPGSSEIIEYLVTGVRQEDGTQLEEQRIPADAPGTATFSGLAGGEPHTFTVAARNAEGVGAPATVTATPKSSPPAPPAPTPAPPAPPAVTPPVPPAVTPPAVVEKTAQVKVKAVRKKSRLRVNVNPNKGRGSWQFVVQKRRKGVWNAMSTVYRTKGSKEIRTINLGKGKYRVVVLPKYGRGGATSDPVRLRR